MLLNHSNINLACAMRFSAHASLGVALHSLPTCCIATWPHCVTTSIVIIKQPDGNVPLHADLLPQALACLRRQHYPALADILAAASASGMSPEDTATNQLPAALEPVRAHLASLARTAAASEPGAAMPPATSADAAAVEGTAAAAPVRDAAMASSGSAAEQPGQQTSEALAAADPASPEQGRGALPLGHSEALCEAAQWLVLLVVAAARAQLPPQGLALLADLTQLLFCRAGPTAPPGNNLLQVRLNQCFGIMRQSQLNSGLTGVCALHGLLHRK